MDAPKLQEATESSAVGTESPLPVATETAAKPLTTAQALDVWEQLMIRTRRLLCEETIDAAWVERFAELTSIVRRQAALNPDLALYVLIEANGSNAEHYSTQHALTCLVIAELAAEWMEWSEEEKWVLARAALSMNLSITSLQDSLAKQSSSLTDSQRGQISVHAATSADWLTKAGVSDEAWLHVVREHHTVQEADVAQEASNETRLAELLRRVDIYLAKLSRRGSRQSITPAMAARDACLDASGHPDSIGATLLRVVGLYPPGTFVELANGETAVVIERGSKAHTPIVASIRRKDGGLLMQPTRRNTLRTGFTVKRGVEPSRVRVLLNHRRILSCA